MYIAMNRFRVAEGSEEAFETQWRNRDSYLEGVPGFQGFHLLRGGTKEGITTYLSHSTWESRDAFSAWTESDSFRKAHSDARSPKGTLAGPPVFEGYEVAV